MGGKKEKRGWAINYFFDSLEMEKKNMRLQEKISTKGVKIWFRLFFRFLRGGKKKGRHERERDSTIGMYLTSAGIAALIRPNSFEDQKP